MSLDAKRSEASRVAARVDLRDIRVWGLDAELFNVPDERESRLSYSFNADLSVQHSQGESILLVLGKYSLTVNAIAPPTDGEEGSPPDDDDESEDVLELNFKLNALFEVEHPLVEGEEPFSESELTAFGDTTGQFALHPYARELVADMTRRMGLPPLLIGVMRLDLESRTG